MKTIKKLLLITALVFASDHSFGQSNVKADLINNWITTTKIFETGDTIPHVNEELNLKKDGFMTMKDRGMTLDGTWEFLKKNNQVELTLQMGNKSETITLELDKLTSDELSLTQRKGDKFMTKNYKKNSIK